MRKKTIGKNKKKFFARFPRKSNVTTHSRTSSPRPSLGRRSVERRRRCSVGMKVTRMARNRARARHRKVGRELTMRVRSGEDTHALFSFREKEKEKTKSVFGSWFFFRAIERKGATDAPMRPKPLMATLILASVTVLTAAACGERGKGRVRKGLVSVGNVLGAVMMHAQSPSRSLSLPLLLRQKKKKTPTRQYKRGSKPKK